ncbi:MAG TPA: hypothetical protein VF763_13820 [Candidatus Limnocylindrales bacterium]
MTSRPAGKADRIRRAAIGFGVVGGVALAATFVLVMLDQAAESTARGSARDVLIALAMLAAWVGVCMAPQRTGGQQAVERGLRRPTPSAIIRRAERE